MNDSRAALMGFVVVVAVSFGGGFLLADHLNKREQVVQVAHPEIRTAPNDVALETAPKAKPKLPAPSKPRGGETVSVTELQVAGGEPVRVTPPTTDGTPECLTAEDFACPGALLRLDLIRTDDGQQYVAARGSDGREITGRYIPLDNVLLPRDKRLTVAAIDGGWLAIASRDYGRWAAGVAGGEIDGRRYYGVAGSVSWR